MRRIALTIVSTIAGLVILLTLKANTAQAPAAASTPPALVAAAPSSAAPAPATGSKSAPATAGKSAAAPASKTVAGTAVKNQYESFQVQLTVAGGKVAKVEILNFKPFEPESTQIAGAALPKLQQATLTNSAKVDTVSGATYTSKSYKESLQAALDKAGL